MSEYGTTPAQDHFIDPLLECLVLVCRHYQIPTTASKLAAGLPLENQRFNPALFIRAADRAGLSARIAFMPLPGVAPLTLPAVILLKDDNCCVLTSLDADNETAQIITPESGEGSERVTLESLEDSYSGSILFVKPRHHYDARTAQNLKLPERHWFWGTLLHSWRIYRDVLIASIMINLFVIISPAVCYECL